MSGYVAEPLGSSTGVAAQQLLLLRHAAATGQEPDAALTADGYRQAALLAEVLLPLGIERVVASPYRRAVETVEPFCAQSGLVLETDVRLTERILSGRSLPDWRVQLQRTFEDADYCLEGGESSREAQARGIAAVLAAAAAGQCCAVVTHGNLLALILQWVDPSVGFEHWSRLSNPDVFLIPLAGGRAQGYRRLWGA